MGLINAKQREAIAPLDSIFGMLEASMGFVPNSMLTMAHWPELVTAFAGLGATVLQSGELEPELKQLIALVAAVPTDVSTARPIRPIPPMLVVSVRRSLLRCSSLSHRLFSLSGREPPCA